MKTPLSKIVSVAVVGALVTGGLAFSAQAASADELTNGTITITPTTGNRADVNFLDSIDVTAGCPVGYRASSDTQIVQGSTRMGSVSLTRFADSPYGNWGFTGGPIHGDRLIAPTNGYLSAKNLDQTTQGQVVNGTVGSDANFELRVYCYADNNNRNYATDKYFSLAMSINSNGDWKVGSAVSVPVPAQATTVSLTGALAGTNTAALTATVKDSTNATATAAPGTVQFLEGTTVLGSAPVVSGVASFTSAALSVGSHAITAKYLSSDTAGWANSPLSGVATVVVPTVAAPPGSTVVDVTIPSAAGVLSYAGLQSTISLGQAVLTGGLFKASGDLGPITITDTRQLGSSSWSLTGVTTDFTSGTKVINGKYLGWKPALVGTSNAGVAGAEVLPAPGSANGLKTAAPLSTGSVVDGITTTVVGAKLNLAAPGNTPGGLYTSTLTLTLL